MSIRTNPPHHYISPSSRDIKAKAKELGVKSISPSFIEDLCNLQAGGDYKSPSQMEKEVNIDKYLDQDFDGDFRYRGNTLRLDNRYVTDLNVAKKIALEHEINYNQKVQDFLKSLDFSNVPGYSPLEKSLLLSKLLATQDGGCPTQDDGDTIPIFNDPKKSDEVTKKIQFALEAVNNLDPIEKELLEIKDGDGKSTMQIAEDMLSGKDIMLKIKRELDGLTRLKVGKHHVLEPDTLGNITRYRPMKNLNEISNISQQEYIYSKNYLNYRMVTGLSKVKERCTRLEKRMLLYIICDCSSSMRGGDRFYKAGGVLMNRLKAVIEENAVVYFTFFDTCLYKEHLATKEMANAPLLMKEIKRRNFNGGSTAIVDCTRQAVSRINRKMASDKTFTKPELMVITDGEDNTRSLTVGNLGGIRLHTIIVGGENEHLMSISRRSGGVGIVVD